MPYATNKIFRPAPRRRAIYRVLRLIATFCLWLVVFGGLILVAALWTMP